MKIGIIAALPGELKPLVKGWKQHPAPGKGLRMWIGSTPQHQLIAACAGMGSEPARRCFAAMEALGRVDVLLSIGWAGALESGLRPGAAFIPTEVIDAQTGERFPLVGGGDKLRLVTVARVADAAEKQRLHDTYGAVMVDMEAAAVARLAQMHDIPMQCFKAVSDGMEAHLPDLNPFINDRGQMRMLPFLLHVAVRPRFWKPLAQLGANSRIAAEELSRTVRSFFESGDLNRIHTTGTI